MSKQKVIDFMDTDDSLKYLNDISTDEIMDLLDKEEEFFQDSSLSPEDYFIFVLKKLRSSNLKKMRSDQHLKHYK